VTLRTKWSFLPSIRPIGVRSAAIKMTVYNEILGPNFLGSRSIATGAMRHSQRTVTCTSRCFPILNRKAPSQSNMAAYREGEGVCERALFVVDKQGKIFWSYYSPIAVNPGADGSLEALERMNGIKSDVQTESANDSG
jgi:hypothetical protein